MQNLSGGEYQVANELNEQQYAAPEQELRSAEPVEMASAEPANIVDAVAPEIESNDGATPSPVIRLVDNKSFKTFSYGEDDSKFSPQKKTELQQNQATEAINAIRHDISLIAVGSSQIQANKNLVSRQAGNDDAHTSVRGQQELRRQLAEQRRIEAWNNTQTMVGGVSMTNAQAQASRKNVIDNDERYADWAAEKGYIRADQKDEFKKSAKEMYNLKEEEKKNGKMTSAQQQRFEELQRSPVGQAVDKATADAYSQNNARFSMSENRVSNLGEAEKQRYDQQLTARDHDTSHDHLIDQAVVEAYTKDTSAPNSADNKKSSGISVASMVSASSISREVDLNGDFGNAVAGTVASQQSVASADMKAKPAGPTPG